MTNDQKLLQLIFKVDEMIKAQDKAEETKSHLHIEQARKLRREMKVWIASNRIITPTAPAIRQQQQKQLSYVTKKKPQFPNSNYNYLAQ